MGIPVAGNGKHIVIQLGRAALLGAQAISRSKARAGPAVGGAASMAEVAVFDQVIPAGGGRALQLHAVHIHIACALGNQGEGNSLGFRAAVGIACLQPCPIAACAKHLAILPSGRSPDAQLGGGGFLRFYKGGEGIGFSGFQGHFILNHRSAAGHTERLASQIALGAYHLRRVFGNTAVIPLRTVFKAVVL